MPAVDENGEYTSPVHVRLPRKPLVRGLSAIVASLRRVEEEALDDDLDALHEMENEGAEPTRHKPVPKPKPTAEKYILVPDTQIQQLPLGGLDDEAMYDSPEEQQLGRDGLPMNLKVYKKKGQKRTTRMVKMKPIWMKRPENAGQEAQEAREGEDEEEEVVKETQFDDMTEPADFGTRSGSEFGGSDSESEDEGQAKSKAKAKAAKSKAKADAKTATKDKAAKKDGPVKKAARKVNELAHTNFRRLKLKNNGAKGGPGFNSKFRRRR